MLDASVDSQSPVRLGYCFISSFSRSLKDDIWRHVPKRKSHSDYVGENCLAAGKAVGSRIGGANLPPRVESEERVISVAFPV